MNYSFIHLKISENYPVIIEEPEKYLGSNYETVLNFWWFIDGLNCEQARILGTAYEEIFFEIITQSYKRITELVETEKYEFEDDIWNGVIVACEDREISSHRGFGYLMSWITLELMVMHELLEKDLPLFFVKFLEYL